MKKIALVCILLAGCSKPITKEDAELAIKYCESKGEVLLRVYSSYAAGHDLNIDCRSNSK